jgi:hypothetical protein
MHVMKAGDSQDVSRERWHGGRVVSAGPMRLLGIMIVEKDEPIIEIKRSIAAERVAGSLDRALENPGIVFQSMFQVCDAPSGYDCSTA